MNSISPDYLQTLLDFSQTGIGVFSPILDASGQLTDFRFKAANRMLASMVGQTPDTVRDAPLSDWLKRHKTPDTLDQFRQAFVSNEARRFEINDIVDGFDVWFDVQCARQLDDLMVTFTDITPLKQAQQAVEWQSAQNRSGAELLNGILDSSDSGIMAFEAIRDYQTNEIVDFRFLMANQACEAIIGRPIKQTVGKSLLRVFPGNVESGLFDGYKRTTETGEPFRTETYYNYDGLDFWLTISAQKHGDGFVVTFNDISVFRRLQQQLENSVADLQRSNESLQQFAYVASHDLQEPLRKIQAFGDMLKTMYAEQLGDGADMIGRMQASAGRMSNLIRDLLAYSRLTNQPVPSGPVSLPNVLALVLDDLELTIGETRATVTGTNTLPTLPGDGFQLHQLFQNLLSNALKFRQEGRSPLIALSVRPVAHADLPPDVKPLRRAAAYHAISVSDNGIGFDERYRERIFQVFQRLHGKQEYMGTGIGLAIVQRVADNHGGAVMATSQLGEGATFTVYLPG
ncbi:MAG: PAS domain-containing protein [Cytophagales bacterium]|nr:MAG: PAS domain-containing protein [Cytophagales bacterium]